MKRNLLIAASILITIAASSQQLWKEETSASQDDYLNRNRNTLPDKVKFYTLDAAVLQSRMLAARTFDAGATTATLEFPLPDGSFITADVYESSILTPQLQAIIPNVKTYVLVDNISKSSLGRITIFDNAITGLIFTNKGTVYINPVNSNNNRAHITYFTKDVHYPLPVGCGVTDEEVLGRQNSPARTYAGDGHLRTYKLAVAATGEYYVWAGSSQVAALSYITITINSINAIYERDATIHFNLVTNNSIIYTDSLADPYPTLPFPNGATLTTNNSSTDAALGAGAYDIGIVFSKQWNGGLALLSSVCGANHGRAAAGLTFGTGANPTAGPQGPIFEGTVAHEMAHQFSATHTMIANNGGCAGNVTIATAYEPGGGSTLMAYAGTCTGNAYQNNSDLYFHAGSVFQIAAYATTGLGNGCPVNTTLTNVPPTVSVAASSYTIPVSTPFVLTCSASDLNANTLTYTWEQMNAPPAAISTPPSATSTTDPNFRSFPQSTNPTRYFPNLPSVLAGTSPTYEVLSSVTRTMNFRVNVRDNAAGGGGNVQADIAVNTNATAGPFTVTSQSSPTSLTADGISTFTVTWNVANSNIAPVSCANVDILFSADGGQNFNYVLLANTANDGTQTLTVPNIVTSSGRLMIKGVGNIFFNVNAADITITSGCGAEGAGLSPSATVNASPGHSSLNLSSAPTFGSIISPAGTLQASDPSSNLAVFSSVSSSCVTFSNVFQYHTYTFQVNIAGTYTFTKSAGNYITNLYTGSYNPASPCSGFIASNGTFNGASVAIGGSVSAAFLPGVVYTLAVGTFATGTPILPFAYTITVTNPGGGNIYSGYPNPGGAFSYVYVMVNNATNNIVAISTTPNLTNSSTFPVGNYTVYGFSYLTANFSAGTLNGYVGGSFATLTNDLLNNPSAKCGNLSKNNVAVNILLVLPVRLLPLTAVWENQEVKLYWSTASETGSKNFEIERSGDGQAFTFLQSVPASVNSDTRKNYISYDQAPLTEKNFYRIKAVDLDGKFVYSNIALVKKMVGGFEIKLYPNPAKDKSTIEILASGNGSGDMEIIGINGSTLHKKKLIWKKGINVEIIDMQNFAAGIYYIKITSETNVITQKIIKI